MASVAVCPRCGFSNQPGYQFCTNCGSPLAVGPMAAAAPQMVPPPAAVYPPAYGPPPYGYGVPPWDYERMKHIDRTKVGVLLLLIGTLFSWILFIGIVGSILLLIGAILVILGRRAFGPAHSRNVIISIVLVIIGFAMALFGALLAILPAFPALQSGDLAVAVPALRSAFTGTLVVVVVSSIVSGLASVLFTYALQNPTGRMLLWAGYGATIGLEIAIFILISGEISALADAVARDIVTAGGDPLVIASATSALTDRVNSLFYLGAIPAVFFALADYLVWNRISKGEIPAPPTPPAMPAAQAPPIQPK